jgi:hypothetical protein
MGTGFSDERLGVAVVRRRRRRLRPVLGASPTAGGGGPLAVALAFFMLLTGRGALKSALELKFLRTGLSVEASPPIAACSR